MAVFTPVSEPELAAWLQPYGLGPVLAMAGIESGVDNTNYFVTLGAPGRQPRQFVLTLFEHLSAAVLPFHLGLMAHLAAAGLPTAAPVGDRQGRIFALLKDKPAALVRRLAGHSVDSPDVAACAAIGDLLARLHLAGRDFAPARGDRCDAAWHGRTAEAVRGFLSPPQAGLLADELAVQARQDWSALPSGPIHGDLFRDNVLFGDAGISGVLDFYYAFTGPWLYDVAVAASDWCLAAGPALDGQRVAALLAGYRARRPLEAVEEAAWPLLLRRAALRFWLSRLYDFHRPRPAEVGRAKDPEHFRRLLEAHRTPVP